MSSDDLFTHTDGLRSFSQTHADVVAELSGLIGSYATATDVGTTHGAIASSVHTALTRVLADRQSAQKAVSETGGSLAESLRRAAHSYEQVDQRSAATVQSAGQALDAH